MLVPSKWFGTNSKGLELYPPDRSPVTGYTRRKIGSDIVRYRLPGKRSNGTRQAYSKILCFSGAYEYGTVSWRRIDFKKNGCFPPSPSPFIRPSTNRYKTTVGLKNNEDQISLTKPFVMWGRFFTNLLFHTILKCTHTYTPRIPFYGTEPIEPP